MGFIRILVVLAGFFAIAYLAGRTWNLKPETKTAHVVHRGEEATLWRQEGGKVWVTVKKDLVYDAQVAMTRQDDATLAGMEARSEAFAVESGSRVKILGESSNKRKIEVLDGAQAGRSGWVAFEYLRLPKPGEP